MAYLKLKVTEVFHFNLENLINKETKSRNQFKWVF